MHQNATFLGQLTCKFWGQIPHFQGEMPFMTGKTNSNSNTDHEHVGIQHALFLQKIRKMVWFMGKIYRKTTCLTLTLGFSWICLIQPVLGKNTSCLQVENTLGSMRWLPPSYNYHKAIISNRVISTDLAINYISISKWQFQWFSHFLLVK